MKDLPPYLRRLLSEDGVPRGEQGHGQKHEWAGSPSLAAGSGSVCPRTIVCQSWGDEYHTASLPWMPKTLAHMSESRKLRF